MGNRRKPRNPAGARGPAGGRPADLDDDFFRAAAAMVPRVGARSFQVRYCDEDDPVVWIAVASFGGRRFEVGAGPNPEVAIMRLLQVLVDGGTCRHCHRPTSITRSFDQQLASQIVCWYQYDPELKKFRRGCA
ncbi:MAG TPA: hypothetical protein VMF51_18065 [Nocardioides sp.]|uniref:hypothetical protein n=1 Tax=Nocardioides sp. TaxID=35761 RepID=UPI002C61A881|nr:hypothetical protein [Nocardioides sp.]HTW17041.1 hypothetical protein [Nocardioides sp.]